MRKTVSFILAVVMLLSLSIPAYAAMDTEDPLLEPLTRVRACELLAETLNLPIFDESGDSPFTDFGPEDDGYAAVLACMRFGIIGSSSNGTFDPNALLTRQWLAKLLCVARLGPTTANHLRADVAPYNDVPADHDFAGYIAYCQKENFMSGSADGAFRPYDAAKVGDANWDALGATPVVYVSRAKACELLAEKLDLPAYAPQESPFSDFGPMDDGYAAVMACVHAGIISGNTDGTFKPNAVFTRGGLAKLLCNALLGPTTAGMLAAYSAPFNDVPVDHTFAGCIAYCAKEGLMTGYSNGSFKPAAAAQVGDVNWNYDRWTAPDTARGIEYEITGITLRDRNFQPISAIPAGTFYAEVSVRNISSVSVDTLMLAAYDANGKMLSLQYLYANPEIGQTFVLGTSVDNTAGNIAKFKAFVVPVLGGIVPLANAVEYSID